MPAASFIHLRNHSAYSLSEGAIPVKKLVDLCVKHHQPAAAITDTNNLFGALEFSGAMLAAGVQPIVGCQLAITRDPGTEEAALQAAKTGRRPAPEPVVLLAQNESGYRNLMALSSHAFLKTPAGEAPQVAFEVLAAHTDGVIALTGGLDGPLARRLTEGQIDAARHLLDSYATLFPDRLYVEIQRHNTLPERRVEPLLLDLADAAGLPIVATNECFFTDESMYEAHDALLCIAEGTYVGVADRRRVTREHRFKSTAEMVELFADLPDAIENTVAIARRCAYAAPERKPILPRFAAGGVEGEAEALRAIAREGLDRRIATLGLDETAAKPYRERLEFELDVIINMKFPGYFLIVADFIQWTKKEGIPVGPGRGSGAGSVVAWALTITDLDPLRFGLLFERFLNPERVSMPDFDIDFCQDRRDEVIGYVQQKYGAANVAQIITFGKLQARAALRDVGRVLQLPLGQVDRLCKMVPNNPANPVTLVKAIEIEPRLQEERKRDDQVDRMMTIACKLEGLYRNASTHAAGVVIGDRPLVELVPLYQDPRSSLPATQFSMKYAEGAGLVKFDFLGLKTLTVLQRAVELLDKRNVSVDLANLPLDDSKTYEMLGRGETVGVFQLESSGMRDMLRQMKADSFEDIIALVALYRPGPMDNIPRYIKCKHGEEKPDYLHPLLEPVLIETQGVIIYQEQVMEIAKILAGYSLGEADLLRRAMGKKIKSEMDAQKERFVTGARDRGVDPGRAAFIFELVEKFAGYGFNKSHAAAYALVAYQTAWLKANYPVEFMAASMTLDLGNTDKLNLFRQELGRLGIKLLPPDVQRSEVVFGVERDAEPDGAVRYALAAVRNVGADAMKEIVAARAAGGRFTGLFDFASRVDPQKLNKRMLENLVKSGAFDALEPSRARAFAAIEPMVRHAQAVAADKGSNQTSLFGDPASALKPQLPEVDSWTPMEQLAKEYEAIGFYLSAHPLDSYAVALRRLDVRSFSDMLRDLGPTVKRIKLAGSVIARQERTSQKGNRFAFVQCSDASGVFEVMVFSELLGQHRDKLEAGQLLVFHVDARLDGDQPRLTVQAIEVLDQLAAKASAGLNVFLRDVAAIDSIRAHLDRAGKGRGLVTLTMRVGADQEEAEIRLPGGFAVTPQLRGAIKSARGVLDAVEI